jgi:hypothetical protein
MLMSKKNNKINKDIIYFYYQDESGREMYRKVREQWEVNGEREKRIWFEHRNEHSHWVKGGIGKNYLYYLPELVIAPPEVIVFIVEGENKVEALAELNLLATCNDSGAGPGKFKPEFAKYFKGRKVVILPDNDKIGFAHSQAIFELLEPVAAKVVELKLDGLEPKEDVIQWLAKPGNTKERLLDLAQELLKDKEVPPAPVAVVGDSWEGEDGLKEGEDEALVGWKPFPLDLLPPVLADYIHHASEALPCDPGYLVLPVLCTAGAVIGTSRMISLKDTWQEPSIFWGCTIADPSTLKSPAFDKGIAPLSLLEDKMVETYEQDLEFWEKQCKGWEETGGKKEVEWGKTEECPCPKKPVEGRFCIDDITVEKVGMILKDNPKGLMLAMDELSGWFSSFGRYKQSGGGSSDRSFWLEVHRGGQRRIDRKTGEHASIRLRMPAISVVGTIQPKTATRVFHQENFDCGLVSRLLLIRPPRRPKIWSDAIIPPEVKDAYFGLIHRMFWADRENCKASDWRPTCLTFTHDGFLAWRKFYNSWGEIQWDSDGEMGYCLAKLEGYAARFALLLAQVEYHSGINPYEQVNESHIARAEKLVEWFSHEANRVYAYVQADQVQIENDHLLDLIMRKGGKITARELLRSNPGKMKSSVNCQAILENLVSRGLGFWNTGGVGAKGGRPVKVFNLTH